MKKKRRGWIWVVILAVLAVAAAFLLPRLLPTGSLDLNAQQYRADKVTKGDIQVTVHGTGSIEAMDTSAVTAGASGIVDEVPVENGDVVKAGQLLARLNADAVNSKIDSLKQQIVVQDATIAKLRAMPGTKYLVAPVDSRVKAVYAREGSDANVSMSRQGALMVLSTDGRMKVSFVPKPGAAVKAGAIVKFSMGATTLSGFITKVPDSTSDKAEAVVANDSLAEGRAVVIKNTKGAELGRGKLEINKPLLVTATSGTVDHLYVQAGDTVKAGKKLVRLTGYILDSNFEAQLVQRQQLQDDLDDAYADLKDLVVTSPADGIVTDLALKQGASAQQGMAVCTIQHSDGYKLVVAVDELDVPKIVLGQKAEISIDALPDQKAAGEVIKIAPIGVKANDVTTYDVTLKVDAPAGTLAAMSSSADIEVAFKSGVLLVPVEAVHTVDGKSWVYGALPQDSRAGQETANAGSGRGGMLARFGGGRGAQNATEQRPMIDVKVGLVSDTWAEILEGLKEGDEVAVPVAQGSGGVMGFGMGPGGGSSGGQKAGTGG